jgi:hypothetical protein
VIPIMSNNHSKLHGSEACMGCDQPNEMHSPCKPPCNSYRGSANRATLGALNTGNRGMVGHHYFPSGPCVILPASLSGFTDSLFSIAPHTIPNTGCKASDACAWHLAFCQGCRQTQER